MASQSAYFTLKDTPDKHDVKTLKRELDSLPGVTSVSVSASGRSLAVDFDDTAVDTDRISKCIHKLGYDIHPC